MKALLEFLKDFSLIPVTGLGFATLTLLALTFIPSLNFIPKAFMFYIMMPFIFGH